MVVFRRQITYSSIWKPAVPRNCFILLAMCFGEYSSIPSFFSCEPFKLYFCFNGYNSCLLRSNLWEQALGFHIGKIPKYTQIFVSHKLFMANQNYGPLSKGNLSLFSVLCTWGHLCLEGYNSTVTNRNAGEQVSVLWKYTRKHTEFCSTTFLCCRLEL